MSVNIGRLKGEMFFKGIKPTEFNLKIQKRLKYGTTMPISMVTSIAHELEVPVEYLMTFGDDNRRQNLHHNIGFDSNIIKQRLIDLGWAVGMAQYLVSDKENQLRYTTYGKKDVAYLGYEVSNLCWIAECSLEYLKGESNVVGEAPEEFISLSTCKFQIDSQSLKDICKSKYGDNYLKIFAERCRISKKYANFLMNGNPFIPIQIIEKITHKLQFESIEIFRYVDLPEEDEEKTEDKKTEKKFLNVKEIRHKKKRKKEVECKDTTTDMIGTGELIFAEGESASGNCYGYIRCECGQLQGESDKGKLCHICCTYAIPRSPFHKEKNAESEDSTSYALKEGKLPLEKTAKDDAINMMVHHELSAERFAEKNAEQLNIKTNGMAYSSRHGISNGKYATAKVPNYTTIVDRVSVIENKYEKSLAIINAAASHPDMIEIINRLCLLDNDCIEAVLDIVKTTLSVFENRIRKDDEDGRGNNS